MEAAVCSRSPEVQGGRARRARRRDDGGGVHRRHPLVLRPRTCRMSYDEAVAAKPLGGAQDAVPQRIEGRLEETLRRMRIALPGGSPRRFGAAVTRASTAFSLEIGGRRACSRCSARPAAARTTLLAHDRGASLPVDRRVTSGSASGAWTGLPAVRRAISAMVFQKLRASWPHMTVRGKRDVRAAPAKSWAAAEIGATTGHRSGQG